MAETSGPRGLCTAPRRRCCPAWLWTATAWAPLRPDACPLLACPARCRLGSTWPASISTRTRVSAPRCGRPLRSPQDPGEGGPGKNCSACSCAFSAGTRHLPFPRRVHGSEDRLNSPGLGQRPVPRTRRKGVRGSVAFLGAPVPSQSTRVCRNPSHRGEIPGPLRLQPRMGFSKSRINQLHTL